MKNTISIIRPGELAELLSVSKVTIWRMEKRGDLPPRKRISRTLVGWIEKDIEEWLRNRPDANTNLDQNGDI